MDIWDKRTLDGRTLLGVSDIGYEYHRSVEDMEHYDREIGRIEAQRASEGRPRMHRDRMRLVRQYRLEAAQNRDYFRESLQKISDLMDAIEEDSKSL